MKDVYPIIGMSPGNSYFKDDVIKNLLKKVVEKYGRAAVFIADVPAISTYIALGYPENRARRDKAIPQGNALKNRTRKAMAELGYTDTQIKIIDWDTEVAHDPRYEVKYGEVQKLYQTNNAFAEAADAATRNVLENTGKIISNMKEATTIAVQYLLAEFAFLTFAPEYLNTEKVVYIYHKEWPVYESYRRGEFDGVEKEHLEAEVV
jgi:cyclo(L-tyrosyl-L-tyrosyl) synthase